MRRKGWGPKEADIPAVVAIHNSVNERAWREVMAWETALHPDTVSPLRLVRFEGRPKDLSPKARLKMLFGYSAPFDRHDWIVERDGEEVRYVIDFYTGARPPAAGAAPPAGAADAPPLAMPRPVSVHIDARPAVDSVGNALDRLRMPVSRFFASVLD
eukprot:g2468.t1